MIVNNNSMSEIEVREIIKACNGEILNSNGVPCHNTSIAKLKNFFDPKNSEYYDINQPLPEQCGWTALAFATFYGKTEEAKSLLVLGADPNVSINNSITVLQIAASEGYTALCASLLKKQANINAQTAKGRTAMMGACENGKLKVVQTMLPYKPNIMIADVDGKTCLDYAQTKEHYDIVRHIEYAILKNKIPLKDAISSGGRKVSKI